MILPQLRYIVAVVETGNITEAAKNYLFHQPSLTNVIRGLENEMQITIFYRTNKGVAITNEWYVSLSYARQVLDFTLRETQTYEIIERCE